MKDVMRFIPVWVIASEAKQSLFTCACVAAEIASSRFALLAMTRCYLLRLDSLGVDEAGPVGDLALQLLLQHVAARVGGLDVELGEALAHLRIAHHLFDRLCEPGL